MAAICRFGMRVVPNISEIIEQCRNKKQLVQGPHISEFEQEFRRVLGGSGHVRAVSTEYGRMALYFILKALNIPAGSEIIVPALTFWVVPEIFFQLAPDFSAATRYIAQIMAAGELIVIDVVTCSSGRPRSRISMSARDEMATPHLPTSPSASAWSLS